MDGTATDLVPCGKCHECLRDRKNSWAFRLKQESRHSQTTSFITLTYATHKLLYTHHDNPNHINSRPTLNPKDLTNFWKRLRKHIYKNYPNTPKLKYYAVGEYGGTYQRPHYHAIIFNIPYQLLQKPVTLTEIWENGTIDVQPSNEKTVAYTLKYVSKPKWQPINNYDAREPQFQRQSLNLGLDYLTPQMKQYHQTQQLAQIRDEGTLRKMPRYYKDKIFTKIEITKIGKEFRKKYDLSTEQWKLYDYIAKHNSLKGELHKIKLRENLDNNNTLF